MKRHKIFETNPNLKEVHMTSDGEAFYNDNDAKMHAKTLKDKTVELVVNPSLIDVITEDVDSEELDIIDQLQTADGIKGEMTGAEAIADGSENVLIEAKTEGVVLDALSELSVEETQDAINLGGDEINIITAPLVEAPEVVSLEVDAPEVATPEVVTPEVKAPKVTPNKGK
jgi:hypothetical protein